ncbi:hypothetical protein [Gemmatimonas sp.]|uniref:hypothetical protein n=1 Tax=Gemmatimonas sp. TaxID=1962908 RepID=UPI00286E0080|nr:hypothetical protein [Gemmatimonas sp.]
MRKTTDAEVDPIGDAFRRAQDEEEATIPPELSWHLLPLGAPPEPPYEPSSEWLARLAMLDAPAGSPVLEVRHLGGPGTRNGH